MSESNEQSVNAPAEESRMEVNCNGYASTPKSGPTPKGQLSEPPTEEDGQQNTNLTESNAESKDLLNNNASEHQSCNGSPGDTNPPQLPAASVSPDSVTVELKEGEKEEMDDRGNVKKEDKDGQNG